MTLWRFLKDGPHTSLLMQKKTKPQKFEEVNSKFSDDNLDKDNILALLLLPKLLPTVANSKTMKPWELEHLRTYKTLLEAPISSALIQVVPFGTNVTLQVSLEAPREERERRTPIFPFLMWNTTDRSDGQIYLKIDQKTFFVGPSSTLDLFLKAVDLLFKSYYCFNLEYHPFLKTTFNFLETLYGIGQPKTTCVTKFITALRNLSATP